MSSMHAPVCPHVVPSHDSKHVTKEQALELLEALHDGIDDPACREGLRRVALYISKNPDPAGTRPDREPSAPDAGGAAGGAGIPANG